MDMLGISSEADNYYLIKRLETDWRKEAKMKSEIDRFEIRNKLGRN
jgi:hypothetical protein